MLSSESNCIASAAARTSTWNFSWSSDLAAALSLVSRDFATTNALSFEIPANILANVFEDKKIQKVSFFSFGNGGKGCAPEFPSCVIAVNS